MIYVVMLGPNNNINVISEIYVMNTWHTNYSAVVFRSLNAINYDYTINSEETSSNRNTSEDE